MMNAFIIEDEKAALRNLTALLGEAAPDMTVIGSTDSIADSIEWFRSHPMPDLVFMDIHLADGDAFEIFEHVDITCPIIFTTAYDEYALRAFKVNSIDYLLKPLNRADLEKSLKKLQRLSHTPAAPTDYARIIRTLKREENYKQHFLIPIRGNKFIPVVVASIYYFYIDNGCVKAVDKEQKEYNFPQTLDELAEQVNPADFFRANRQYLIAKKAIRDVDLWFGRRLAVNLLIPTPERILISKARVNDFREWFV